MSAALKRCLSSSGKVSFLLTISPRFVPQSICANSGHSPMYFYQILTQGTTLLKSAMIFGLDFEQGLHHHSL